MTGPVTDTTNPDEKRRPTVDEYVEASRGDSPVSRALSIHYPADTGPFPFTCAVCYFWPGGTFKDVVQEPWPCPTVRALMAEPSS